MKHKLLIPELGTWFWLCYIRRITNRHPTRGIYYWRDTSTQYPGSERRRMGAVASM